MDALSIVEDRTDTSPASFREPYSVVRTVTASSRSAIEPNPKGKAQFTRCSKDLGSIKDQF
jgi:hypothetical protein